MRWINGRGLVSNRDQKVRKGQGVSEIYKNLVPADRSENRFSVLEMERSTHAPLNAYLVLICTNLETAECVASYFL